MPPPGKIVIQAYRWEGNQFVRYQFRSDKKLYRVLPDDQWTLIGSTTGSPIRDLVRLEFYSQDPPPSPQVLLFRVDVIPGNNSSLDIGTTAVTVQTRVRSFLWTESDSQQPEQSIPLRVKLRSSP